MGLPADPPIKLTLVALCAFSFYAYVMWPTAHEQRPAARTMIVRGRPGPIDSAFTAPDELRGDPCDLTVVECAP